MNPAALREKLTAANKLTSGDSTTLDRTESVITLLQGIDSRLDRKLSNLSKSLSTLKNLQEGNVIELSAERLPEETEEEKKRKRAIIFFIKNLKDLKSEIARIKNELDAKSREEQTGTETAGKITAFAKGPFGLLTIAAIIAVGGFVLVKGKTTQNRPPPQSTATIATTPAPTPPPTPSPLSNTKPSATPKTKIQVISYNGKQIPLDQLEVRTGPDCTNSPQFAPHYHAKNNQYVRATDGSMIPDPGGCAFGKESEVQVEEIEIPSHTSPSLF